MREPGHHTHPVPYWRQLYSFACRFRLERFRRWLLWRWLTMAREPQEKAHVLCCLLYLNDHPELHH